MFENRIHLSILNARNKYLHIHQLIQLSSSSELSRSELAFSKQGAPVSGKASRRFLCEFSFAGRPLFFGCAPFFTAFWLSPRLLFWMVSRIRSLMFWSHCAVWYLGYADCIYILVNQCNGLNLMNDIRDNCQVLAETLLDIGDHTAAAEVGDRLVEAAVNPARHINSSNHEEGTLKSSHCRWLSLRTIRGLRLGGRGSSDTECSERSGSAMWASLTLYRPSSFSLFEVGGSILMISLFSDNGRRDAALGRGFAKSTGNIRMVPICHEWLCGGPLSLPRVKAVDWACWEIENFFDEAVNFEMSCSCSAIFCISAWIGSSLGKGIRVSVEDSGVDFPCPLPPFLATRHHIERWYTCCILTAFRRGSCSGGGRVIYLQSARLNWTWRPARNRFDAFRTLRHDTERRIVDVLMKFRGGHALSVKPCVVVIVPWHWNHTCPTTVLCLTQCTKISQSKLDCVPLSLSDQTLKFDTNTNECRPSIQNTCWYQR